MFTGLSTSSHAASSKANTDKGWWEYMIGPGKPINTEKYYNTNYDRPDLEEDHFMIAIQKDVEI